MTNGTRRKFPDSASQPTPEPCKILQPNLFHFSFYLMPNHSRSTALILRILIFLLASWMVPALKAEPIAQPLVLGTVATDIPSAMARHLAPLTNYLSTQLEMPIQLRPAPNMRASIEDFGSGVTQITYLTPVAFLETRERFGAIAIALPLTDGQPTFRLAIVVRKSSPVKQLKDLVGRSFAFGDEKSLLQRATLESGGLPLAQLSHYAYLKYLDNVAKAVLNGDFDAGIMKESIAHKFASKGLRIIHLSPPLPTFVIAINRQFPAEKIPVLRNALLKLNVHEKTTHAILTALDPSYTGFTPATENYFQSTKTLIAPYRK